MNQIAQQGKDMLEIVEKYEVPEESTFIEWLERQKSGQTS